MSDMTPNEMMIRIIELQNQLNAVRAALMNIESYPDDSEYTSGWLGGVREQRERIKKALGDK